MTTHQYSHDPFAAHAALDEMVDRASLALDAMERGLRCGDDAEYEEAECAFFDLYDRRSELDSKIIARPITECAQLWQKLQIVRRIVEQTPEWGGHLLRQLADEVEAWSEPKRWTLS